MKLHPDSTACDCCGKEIPPGHAEPMFNLPDEVYLHIKEGIKLGDFITDEVIDFQDRCYIRALLPIPLVGSENFINIGIWVEVEQKVLYYYIDSMGQSSQQVFNGKLANVLPNYPNEKDVEVSVCDDSDEVRPRVSVKFINTPLGQLQMRGVAQHDIIDFFGNQK